MFDMGEKGILIILSPTAIEVGTSRYCSQREGNYGIPYRMVKYLQHVILEGMKWYIPILTGI